MTRTRRSGPGGQHRNKVETAVVLAHLPTGIVASASERRSQEQNRQMALFRLRVLLAIRVRSPFSGNPSRMWESRLLGRRLAVSASHDDFPSLLAESLDALAAVDWNVAQAATTLGLSASQLVKFLRREAEALAILNAERAMRGLAKLQ